MTENQLTYESKPESKSVERPIEPSNQLNIEVFDGKNPKTMSNIIRQIPLVIADQTKKEMKNFLKAFVAAGQMDPEDITMQRAQARSQMIRLGKDAKSQVK